MSVPSPHALVRQHTVYSCVMGSRAFGLATEDSDTDRRGVFAAPASAWWGFDKPPTHVEGPAPEQFSWEVERFCALGLRANPTVLECLHSPVVEYVDEVGQALLDLRGAFLSLRVRETFGGFADRQESRLRTAAARGAPRWKAATHLVRVLVTCRDLLRTGRLRVDVGTLREPLLEVRRGELPWPRLEEWVSRLRAEIEEAAARSPLPVEPDRDRVADFLFQTRRRSLPPDAWPVSS
ncbi:nucleotidyltransferase domain-containing protein [Streptomyces sp. NPDC005438]|uniref:nucleotidyltransferase domain-containing protein n=1 Tax=Streptomyces sp. NPDC005438 TaxID=3156880 RepID=UPI0033A7B0A7